MRPYWKRSLQERIYTRPFLSLPEKKHLAFQLLHGLCQMHLQRVPHGDLKSENIFIVSGLHLLITDFGYPIKPTYIPDSEPGEFAFYFQTEKSGKRRRCYLAPERLIEGKTTIFPLLSTMSSAGGPKDVSLDRQEQQMIDAMLKMDVFSAGCILGEIFLDGSPLIIDLPEVLFYRNNPLQFYKDTLEPRLKKIRDSASSSGSKNSSLQSGGLHLIADLIESMVQIDADKRPNIGECLAKMASDSSMGNVHGSLLCMGEFVATSSAAAPRSKNLLHQSQSRNINFASCRLQ